LSLYCCIYVVTSSFALAFRQ